LLMLARRAPEGLRLLFLERMLNITAQQPRADRSRPSIRRLLDSIPRAQRAAAGDVGGAVPPELVEFLEARRRQSDADPGRLEALILTRLGEATPPARAGTRGTC
jgi:hypothetical protein